MGYGAPPPPRPDGRRGVRCFDAARAGRRCGAPPSSGWRKTVLLGSGKTDRRLRHVIDTFQRKTASGKDAFSTKRLGHNWRQSLATQPGQSGSMAARRRKTVARRHRTAARRHGGTIWRHSWRHGGTISQHGCRHGGTVAARTGRQATQLGGNCATGGTAAQRTARGHGGTAGQPGGKAAQPGGTAVRRHIGGTVAAQWRHNRRHVCHWRHSGGNRDLASMTAEHSRTQKTGEDEDS
eukprot:gene13292-biopygen12501